MNRNQLAQKVLSSNPLDSDLNDSFTLCAYISEMFGMEIEISEAQKVLQTIKSLRDNQPVFAGGKGSKRKDRRDSHRW